MSGTRILWLCVFFENGKNADCYVVGGVVWKV